MTEPVLNRPNDLNVLGSLALSADITFQCDDEGPATFSMQRNVIFDANAWECEVIWQAVQAIADKHGSYVEATEAVEIVAKRLQTSPDAD